MKIVPILATDSTTQYVNPLQVSRVVAAQGITTIFMADGQKVDSSEDQKTVADRLNEGIAWPPQVIRTTQR
jgi:hypothetical protein